VLAFHERLLSSPWFAAPNGIRGPPIPTAFPGAAPESSLPPRIEPSKVAGKLAGIRAAPMPGSRRKHSLAPPHSDKGRP